MEKTSRHARAMRGIATATRGLLDLIYPPLCHACERTRSRVDSSLCEHCGVGRVELLPGRRCVACAGDVDGLGVCCDCSGAHLPFEQVIVPGAYDGVLRELIVGLKYRRRVHLAAPLGELIAKQIVLQGIELPTHVVPVPLTLGRRMKRGFNQADLIAGDLARRLHLIHAPRALRRPGFRAPRQTSLSRRRRAANVRGAFRIGRPLPERATVLLVDDVVTTARTVIEAALTLCESGVTRVVVAAAARTVRRSPDRDRR